MSEISLELLGRLVTEVLDGQREIKTRLARIEETLATKEQLGLVWRSLELKLELHAERQRDATAELTARLERPEVRVAALEARP
jgi:thiamine monophosphate kinase